MIEQAKKSWGVLAQGAAWILSIIGGFLLPPPVGTLQQSEKVWLRLAQFIITIILGFLFLAGRKWNRKRHVPRWWGISVAFFFLSIIFFIGYQHYSAAWTCSYYQQVRIVGSSSSFTPHGLEYFNENPGASCEDALNEHGGKATDIWTRASINSRQITLAGIYISCVPVFTVCIIAVLQAIQILEKKKKSSS